MKSILLIIFFFFSTISFTQQSLDSLRLVLPQQASGEILSCDISVDGKMILTFGQGNLIHIWDYPSGKKLQRIDVERGSNIVKFSPNSKSILACSPDGYLSLFDIQSSGLIWQLKLNWFVPNIGFSNFGNTIYIEEENALKILNSLTGEIKEEIPIDNNCHLFNDENGELFILHKYESQNLIYQLDNHNNFIQISENFKNIKSVFMNIKENYFLTVDTNQIVSVFNLDSQKQINSFQIQNKFLNAKIGWKEKILVTVSCDSIAFIYDIVNGDLIKEIKFNGDCISSFSINPDNSKIVFGLFDSGSWNAECLLYSFESDDLYNFNSSSRAEVKFAANGMHIIQGNSIFEVNSVKRLRNFQESLGVPISDIFFSNEDSIIICENYSYNFLAFNLYPGISDSYDGIYSLKWIEKDWIDSNYIIGTSDIGDVYLLNKETNNFIWKNNLHQIQVGAEGEFCYAFYNLNRNFIISYGSDGKVYVLDSKNGNIINVIEGYKGRCLDAQISDDNKFVCTFDDSNIFRVLNRETGKILIKKSPISDEERIYYSKLVKNDSLVLTVWSNGLIEIWDLNSGESKNLVRSNFPLKGADLSKDYRYIIALSEEHISLFNINGELIYERIQLQNNNWLVKLPNSPYYMCSKDASKMLHYVTPSLKVIGFEQLDPVYNRPDIVLDSIGKYFDNEDRGMIEEYRKSWEKRINKLGLDVGKLGKGEIAVPSAEIVGADDIAYENKTGELAIGISANDAKYPLRRFNVYVNEVPLYGSAGVSIAHLNKQVWDTTVSVPLSIGENKIQVSVMNELGLENFKYPTYVNYTPTQAVQAKTYYIGIGVNEFVQSAHNLKYCVKDVRDLAKAFSDQNSNTDTLLFTNQQVTKENILALKTLLFQTTVNDKVIISCSSHGLLDDSLNFYLAMHDVDFANPKARGLKYEELESLLDGIPARQKLLLLDACNSGENDQTELLKKELEQNQTMMDTTQLLAARGVVVELEEQNTNNFKKMSELFVNVRNNTGSVIISAAGGQESALEAIEVDGKIIENGAFTYSILECLKQNQGQLLKVNTLKQYAEKRVEEITDGKQKPTSRQETMEIDWGVR